MAVILALSAALANALTSILQRLAAADAPAEDSFHLRLIIYLVRRPIWLAGMVTLIAGFLLQASALRFGDLAVVQPLLTTEVVFLLIVMRVWMRVPLGPVEWISAFAIAVGLGTFLGVAQPTGGTFAAGPAVWALAGTAGLAAAAVFTGFALLAPHGSAWRAGLFGAAAAVTFAFTATVMKDAAETLNHVGWARLFGTWLPYTMAAVGILGLFLAQNAFHAGPVGASQSALTIVDPLASVLIGVYVFNENIRSAGWAVGVEVVAFAVMVVGMVVLSHSSVVMKARYGTDDDSATSLEAATGLSECCP